MSLLAKSIRTTANVARTRCSILPRQFGGLRQFSTKSSGTDESDIEKSLRHPSDVPASTEKRLEGMFYDESIRLSRRQKQVFSRVEDEPALQSIPDHGYLYGFTEEELAGASDIVKMALSTRTGSMEDQRKFHKQGLLAKYAQAPFDTGSSRVQGMSPSELYFSIIACANRFNYFHFFVTVAMITDSISRMSIHLQRNKKDSHNKRQLHILTSRRRRLLQYMIKNDYQNYRLVIKEFGLRPIPVFGNKHTLKTRTRTHKQINERNKRLKNRNSRGSKGH